MAELNLLAATGLPGAENLDVHACKATLDEWAGIVRRESERRSSEAPDQPGKQDGTRARFLATVLAEALQEELGLKLLGQRGHDVDFRLPANVFIHGCLKRKTASSVSGPIVYVAVGRRLGYPLELAMAGSTVVVRWSELISGETFNIDLGAGRVRFPADSFYTVAVARSGKMPGMSQVKIRSLDRTGELAYFLSLRGRCLAQAGRLQDAQVAFAQAHRLAPREPLYLAQLGGAVQAEIGGRTLGASGSGRPSPSSPRMGAPDPMADLEQIMRLNPRTPGMPSQQPGLPGAPGLPRPPDPFGPMP